MQNAKWKSKFCKLHSATGGFTLLEVMVALLIIATSFIVLLHSRNQSVIAADYARHMTIATLLATEKMGEMEQMELSATGEDSGNFGEDYPEFVWRTIISDTAYEQVREVRVEVSWGEGEGRRNVELVNYIKAVTNE
ncbi:MAG: type II secretion system minor pseudopilin GspI [Nitrospirota bacterium]|nr:type II secretion system minor pseudopilin GspI [Nitrospirota bacterium]